MLEPLGTARYWCPHCSARARVDRVYVRIPRVRVMCPLCAWTARLALVKPEVKA